MSTFLNRNVIMKQHISTKNFVAFECCLRQAQTVHTAYSNPSKKKVQAWDELIAQIEEFCNRNTSNYRVSLLHAGRFIFSVVLWMEILPFQLGSGYVYITRSNCYIYATPKNRVGEN